MTFTPKEASLLKGLKLQEELCTEKYQKYAKEACDQQLHQLFTRLAENEQQHRNTIAEIMTAGTVPPFNGGGFDQESTGVAPSRCSASEKQADQYLCADALSMEKYVSADYNTSIFEIRDSSIRDALNHIQKEEQQHGELLYNYMSQNGMCQ